MVNIIGCKVFTLANDMECKALRTSTVKLKMFNEIVKTLGNVRYELGRNLISLGRLVFWGMDILQEAEL